MLVLLSLIFSNKTSANLLAFLLFGIFLSTTTQAQQSSDTLRASLEGIKVTAIRSTISPSKAPLSLTTLTQTPRALNGSSSLSFASLGNQLPGLWVSNRHNYALGERLTIRGIGWRAAFGVRGIQVIYNGIPLTVADGQTMINIVEPAFIRRAEIVRGPAATYWGNSSGGVLYLSTMPATSDSSNIRFRSMAGSFGMRKVETEYSFIRPNHKMSVHGSYLTSDGFRNYSSVTNLRNGITGNIQLTSKSQLAYHTAAIYMPKAQHPSSLTKQQAREHPRMARAIFSDSAKAGKTITQGQAGASYLLNTSAGLLNVSGYGIYRDLSNPLPFGIITVSRWAGGMRTTFDKSWNNLNLQAGIETKLQNDDRTEYENIGNAQRGETTVDQIEQVWSRAAFVTGTYSYKDLNLMAGLRFDKITFQTDDPDGMQSGKRTFQAFSPSLGVSISPGNHTIFANFSTSFEAPTTTELVNRPGGGNGFNPNIRPENTVSVEAGVRGSIIEASLQYDIAAYKLWIRDLLFPYQPDPDGPTFYRNQGKTNHIGIEGRLSWDINRQWQASSTFNFTGATFKKGQSESLTGNKIPGIPPVRINNRIKWSSSQLFSVLTHTFTGDYFVNNKNMAKNDSYNLFNIKFGYDTSITNSKTKIKPFVNINNLFDYRYNGSVVVNAFGGRYYEPAPGRNWQVGITIDF